MRSLHVVSLSEDGRYVLLAPSRNAAATYRVPVEGRLAAAVRGDLPRSGEASPRESTLSVREIQSRLRAGESVEEIARSAGVPAAKVERFAGPVVSERARIVDAARAAVLERSRRGASAVPLGDAVDAHLAETAGLDEGSVRWSARRTDDGSWLVEVWFSARGRRKRSGWRYDPARRELHAVDASSSVLGFVDPDEGTRPAKVVAAAPSAGPRRRAPAKRTAKATTGRSTAAAKVPAAARKAPAVTRTAAKAAAPTPAKAAATRTAPGKQPPPAQARASRPPGARRPSVPPAARTGPAAAAATGRRPAARRAAAEPEPQSPPQLRVVPDPDAAPARRASVPAWADVLLSTTPPSRASDAD